ncbi:MAG TPA: transporter [Flavobacterium sp.]|nr:transporter [Flavobacterium sp.]
MNNLKRLSVVFMSLLSGQVFYAQYTDIINSNRPSESFSAFSVGESIFQLEGGASYVNEKMKKIDAKAKGVFIDLDVRYGLLFEELEFISELQYRKETYQIPYEVYDKRSFMSKTSFGFKYLVYDPYKNYVEKPNIYSWKANHSFKWRQFIPAVAVYAGVNLNFSDNPYIPSDRFEASPKLMLILQNQFNGGWVFITNIALNNISSDYSTIEGILTATKAINRKWSGFGEIQGIKGDYYNDIFLRTGAAYLLDDNLQLDVSIGKNFNTSRDIIYGGVGASWRFTFNYRDLFFYRVLDEGSAGPAGMIPEEEIDPNAIVEDTEAVAGEEVPAEGISTETNLEAPASIPDTQDTDIPTDDNTPTE